MGKEKDDEINVNGGDYDSRLGRWLSIDKLVMKIIAQVRINKHTTTKTATNLISSGLCRLLILVM